MTVPENVIPPRVLRRNGSEGRVVADIAVEEAGGPDIDAVIVEDGRFLVVGAEMHFLEIASADEIEFGDVQFDGHVTLLLLLKKGRSPCNGWSQRYAVRFFAAVMAVTREEPDSDLGSGRRANVAGKSN